MKCREDEAVVSGFPGEEDAGGVGDARDGDAVAVFGGRTQRFGHLLFTHAPVGGQEGEAAQQKGQGRLDEGQVRRAHLLQQRHHAVETGGFELMEEKRKMRIKWSRAEL